MVRRTDDEMLVALKDHLDNLEDDLKAAMQAEEPRRHLKQISGTLRILICSVSNHEPLLTSSMVKHNIPIDLTFDRPPLIDRSGKVPPSTMSFEDYVDSQAVFMKDHGSISHGELVRLWAHKLGGAHEDSKLPQKLADALAGGVIPEQLLGFNPSIRTLCLIAEHTLTAGRFFFEHLEQYE